MIAISTQPEIRTDHLEKITRSNRKEKYWSSNTWRSHSTVWSPLHMIRMWIFWRKKKYYNNYSISVSFIDCSGYKFFNIWQNLFRLNCINFANLLLNFLVLNFFYCRCFTRFHYTIFEFSDSVLSAQVVKKVRKLFDKELVIEKSVFCSKNYFVN